MNPATTRWITALLPAVLVLILGWLVRLRPAAAEADLMQRRVENQGEIRTKEDAIRLAEAESDAVRARAKEKSAAAGASPLQFSTNAAARELSDLCEKHRLSLNSADVDKAAQLPPALKTAAGAVSGTGQIWRVDLTGAYPDLQALLSGLNKSGPLIIPLSISMTAAEDGASPPQWSLLLWL